MEYASFTVPLGFISELPADSCEEIKASEGEKVVNDKYWLSHTRSTNALLTYCDMKTGKWTRYIFSLLKT